jgi:hypothetical protein
MGAKNTVPARLTFMYPVRFLVWLFDDGVYTSPHAVAIKDTKAWIGYSAA